MKKYRIEVQQAERGDGSEPLSDRLELWVNSGIHVLCGNDKQAILEFRDQIVAALDTRDVISVTKRLLYLLQELQLEQHLNKVEEYKQSMTVKDQTRVSFLVAMGHQAMKDTSLDYYLQDLSNICSREMLTLVKRRLISEYADYLRTMGS